MHHNAITTKVEVSPNSSLAVVAYRGFKTVHIELLLLLFKHAIFFTLFIKSVKDLYFNNCVLRQILMTFCIR